MDATLFDTLKRQALEPRSDSLAPHEHRLLSFWQAYYSCAPVRNGGACRNPNSDPLPYELDASYWLYALATEADVENFVMLGNIITTDMAPSDQGIMLDFIANLPTGDIKDKDALHMVYAKACELTFQPQ